MCEFIGNTTRTRSRWRSHETAQQLVESPERVDYRAYDFRLVITGRRTHPDGAEGQIAGGSDRRLRKFDHWRAVSEH
jgi:hypothetical protein